MGRSIDAVLASTGIRVDEESLSHYGKKGMKWGERKARKAEKHAIKNERVVENKRRAEARAKTKSLSDEELKSAISRLELEKKYKDLNAHQISEGQKLVHEILRDVGKQTAKGLITNSINSAVNAAKSSGSNDDVKAALLKQALKSAPKPAPGPMKLKLVGQT